MARRLPTAHPVERVAALRVSVGHAADFLIALGIVSIKAAFSVDEVGIKNVHGSQAAGGKILED